MGLDETPAKRPAGAGSGQLISRHPAGAAALEVIARLRRAGHRALLVGGAVRDLLLGRAMKDFDVATSALPQDVSALFERTEEVGAAFGVMLVMLHGEVVQVATFRTDGPYSDRRRPDSIRHATESEDVRRRDFTVNALFYDPETASILDYVGGLEDIDRRVLRTVGSPDERFAEDALRILRALRFGAALAFVVDADVLAACRRHRATIHDISAERIADELLRGFTSGRAHIFLDLLDSTGLLDEILPEVARLKGVEQGRHHHPEGDVYVHTRLMLSFLEEGCSPVLAYGALFHDIAKPDTFRRDEQGKISFHGHAHLGAEVAESVLRRLRYPNELIEGVVTLVQRHMTFGDLEQMRASTWKRFFAGRWIVEEIELHRLDCLGSHGGLDNYHLARQRLQELGAEAEAGALPDPLVRGEDVLALGFPPGRAVGDLLHAAYDAQLEGLVTDRESALNHLRTLAERAGAPALKGIPQNRKNGPGGANV